MFDDTPDSLLEFARYRIEAVLDQTEAIRLPIYAQEALKDARRAVNITRARLREDALFII